MPLQFVWPKDGPRGRSRRRGFFGGLNDIVKGKGPDIFIARQGDPPIAPERWGNWDSYHSFGAHVAEQANPARLWHGSRGFKRYDPETRTYKHWAWPQDWNGDGSENQGLWGNGDGFPRFTQREMQYILRQRRLGRRIDPLKIPNWNHNGPNRFRQEHDYFWQEAHRLGTNRNLGPLGQYQPPNPLFLMHQEWEDDPMFWNW
ncbi:hypothetical protein EG329_003095 [Mollisiaceae sp. DMI_Dod_QoI]|nr:hypothetical protein EG329_003095 [Helotiales sp. DMI_Dod_QoI]